MMKTRLTCLILVLTFYLIHGQLSIDELFTFNSKYTSVGDCNRFQYNFSSIRIHNQNYTQLNFDCNSTSLILQSTEFIQSTICPEDEASLRNFRIHFDHLFFSTIQVNQFCLHGIELCSIDDLIQSTYVEFAYYRSTWALLINLEHENEQHHIAIATNGEMTFIIFLLASLELHQIEIIFPNEHIFRFNQSSSMNIWRIDEGFIRIPKPQDGINQYQLSKTKFSLFNNETFFIYGTQLTYPKLLNVYIDQTRAKCDFDHILRCQFPVLPLIINDTHEPILKMYYSVKSIFNSTISLIPRQRLNQIPTSHNLTNLETFVVNIDESLCSNNSLKSLYSLIAHVHSENINGTRRYTRIQNSDLLPISCNSTVEIGREIIHMIQSIKSSDILSLNVDLIHRWYEHEDCRTETTRINILK